MQVLKSPVRCAVIAGLLSCTVALAQEGSLDKTPPKGMAPEQVIRLFTAKEKEWKNVRQQYTFRQATKVETLNGNDVSGEFRQVADVHYVNGAPVKTVVFGPQPSLQMSKQDMEDLDTRGTFTISTDELPQYNVLYVGQQKQDELNCYVFDIAPKQMEKDKRYFQGRLWVDDQTYEIVKNTGKSVPDIHVKKKKGVEENLFPTFSTWRQFMDGYWFPAFSSADDTLHFANGSDAHIRQVVKFTEYKKK
jgi:hypothetical protein